MPIWPEHFCPLINTFQETPPENTIRTTMDRGPAKVRRRTTANVRNVSFSMYLDSANVAVMDDFFINQTYSGADAFEYTHPRTGETVNARFVAPPQYRNRSRGFEVQVQLEIMP